MSTLAREHSRTHFAECFRKPGLELDRTGFFEWEYTRGKESIGTHSVERSDRQERIHLGTAERSLYGNHDGSAFDILGVSPVEHLDSKCSLVVGWQRWALLNLARVEFRCLLE